MLLRPLWIPHRSLPGSASVLGSRGDLGDLGDLGDHGVSSRVKETKMLTLTLAIVALVIAVAVGIYTLVSFVTRPAPRKNIVAVYRTLRDVPDVAFAQHILVVHPSMKTYRYGREGGGGASAVVARTALPSRAETLPATKLTETSKDNVSGQSVSRYGNAILATKMPLSHVTIIDDDGLTTASAAYRTAVFNNTAELKDWGATAIPFAVTVMFTYSTDNGKTAATPIQIGMRNGFNQSAHSLMSANKSGRFTGNVVATFGGGVITHLIVQGQSAKLAKPWTCRTDMKTGLWSVHTASGALATPTDVSAANTTQWSTNAPVAGKTTGPHAAMYVTFVVKDMIIPIVRQTVVTAVSNRVGAVAGKEVGVTRPTASKVTSTEIGLGLGALVVGATVAQFLASNVPDAIEAFNDSLTAGVEAIQNWYSSYKASKAEAAFAKEIDDTISEDSSDYFSGSLDFFQSLDALTSVDPAVTSVQSLKKMMQLTGKSADDFGVGGDRIFGKAVSSAAESDTVDPLPASMQSNITKVANLEESEESMSSSILSDPEKVAEFEADAGVTGVSAEEYTQALADSLGDLGDGFASLNAFDAAADGVELL